MATIHDVTSKIDTILKSVDALKVSVDAAVADLATAVAAGQSAELDAIMVTLETVATKIGAIEVELTDAIKAIPTPPVAPAAPVAGP